LDVSLGGIESEVLAGNLAIRTEDDGSFEKVFEFPAVAGKRVRLEQGYDLGGQFGNGLAQFSGVAV
jgi:hypothetical protein